MTAVSGSCPLAAPAAPHPPYHKCPHRGRRSHRGTLLGSSFQTRGACVRYRDHFCNQELSRGQRTLQHPSSEHQLSLGELSFKLPTTVLPGAHPPRRKSVQLLKRAREMSKDNVWKNSQDTLLSEKKKPKNLKNKLEESETILFCVLFPGGSLSLTSPFSHFPGSWLGRKKLRDGRRLSSGDSWVEVSERKGHGPWKRGGIRNADSEPQPVD